MHVHDVICRADVMLGAPAENIPAGAKSFYLSLSLHQLLFPLSTVPLLYDNFHM